MTIPMTISEKNEEKFANIRISSYLCNGNIIWHKMCTITLSYNENDIVAREKLAALLATGLFMQQDASKELDIDYSDSSLYEENDLMALPGEKDNYSPEELRTLLISDLNSLYGVKDAV